MTYHDLRYMLETPLHTKLMSGGGGRHTHAREEAKFKLKEQLSPVCWPLHPISTLNVHLLLMILPLVWDPDKLPESPLLNQHVSHPEYPDEEFDA